MLMFIYSVYHRTELYSTA